MLHLRDNVFFDDFDEKDNADKQALAAEKAGCNCRRIKN